MDFRLFIGSLEIVMNLLSVLNVDVNVIDIQKTTPVHWAVINNRPDILRLLIQQLVKCYDVTL